MCANLPARLHRQRLRGFLRLRANLTHQTVEISNLPSCDCPDFAKGNSPCKHIIFILCACRPFHANNSLKVLKVPMASGVWYQRALLVGSTS